MHLFLSLLSTHRAPLVKQVSRQLIHPSRKHFPSMLSSVLGVHSLYQPLFPLHLHCTAPRLKFTARRKSRTHVEEVKVGEDRHVFLFKRRHHLTQLKTSYAPFQQRKRKAENRGKGTREGSRKGKDEEEKYKEEEITEREGGKGVLGEEERK